jgi:hypothetical protein
VAAQAGAVSSEAPRVYWSEGGHLYLREGNQTKPVDAAQGGGGEFQTASADGSVAYFTDGGDLYRFSATTGIATALTSTGDVEGVLGASEDGTTVYYATAAGVFLAKGASSTKVAAAAATGDYPPATGTSRVSADGAHLAFLSEDELTGYENVDANTGLPDAELYLYGPPPGGGAPTLVCVSCNPSGERPQGSAAIPGARPNGKGSDSTDAYKPRVLSSSGNRAFFESADALSSRDTNKRVDVYEWEAAGEGTCVRQAGCVQLISDGRDNDPSYFLDADQDGGEALFLTAASLYPLDPGSYDVYVAREGGGFPLPARPIPCVADACQILPPAPEDPTPGTLVPNSGNPALKVTATPNGGSKTKKKHKRHHGKKSKKRSIRGAGGER